MGKIEHAQLSVTRHGYCWPLQLKLHLSVIPFFSCCNIGISLKLISDQLKRCFMWRKMKSKFSLFKRQKAKNHTRYATGAPYLANRLHTSY
jgi:hypothetical protein